MEFWTAVRVILRRWYVVVACVVMFGLLAAFVYQQIKPSYQVSGQMFVIQVGQPTDASSADKSNPFGSANQYTQDLADLSSGSAFADGLVAHGGTGTYAVAPSISNSTLLLASVTAASPDAATHDYEVLVDQVKQLVDKSQKDAGAPAATLYGLQIQAPDRPAQLVGSRTKALILLGVVGILITLALVFLVDAFAVARTRDRAADEAATNGPRALTVAEDTVSLDDPLLREDEPGEPDEPYAPPDRAAGS